MKRARATTHRHLRPDHDTKDTNPIDLTIIARAVTLVDPLTCPETAIAAAEGAMMVPSVHDPKLMIDRYDVRHLLAALDDSVDDLDDISDTVDTITRAGRRPGYLDSDEPDAAAHEREWTRLETELDDERYRDLPASDNEEEGGLTAEEVAANARAKRRRNERDAVSTNEINWDYAAAEGKEELLDKPTDPKDLEILHRTATFILSQPDVTAAENLIARKQYGQPQFAFLARAHPHRAYFDHVLAAMRDGTWTAPSPPSSAQVPPPLPRRDSDDLMAAMRATARYVAQHGADFEAKLRAQHDAKLAFLNPWHGMHAGFRALVQKERLEMGGAKADAGAESMQELAEEEASVLLPDSMEERSTHPIPVVIVAGRAQPSGSARLVAYASSDEETDE
ncbi:hypothetical protein AMAG_07504 [Allomyces macrogynus ATCC 38327]|uniref:SURP motif domain-containing protein n=1 Tax=Allomyces macrogynus (strain ATCC 38327) TaxID=578462 RepID=A0A0L0SIC6_ALLM3|nr:hypothetical protein AMAG_07504 [Allomyces macrogynus ATCC 38327]|eukprot:KNE62271.1 hypothetical protein AMAG_07504 [Allomyces macrogynus ATCC 38327]